MAAVQVDLTTVHVPRQAGPADPPLGLAAPVLAAPGLVGRDRPRTGDERVMLLGLAGIGLALSAVIVVFLLVSEHVWS